MGFIYLMVNIYMGIYYIMLGISKLYSHIFSLLKTIVWIIFQMLVKFSRSKTVHPTDRSQAVVLPSATTSLARAHHHSQ